MFLQQRRSTGGHACVSCTSSILVSFPMINQRREPYVGALGRKSVKLPFVWTPIKWFLSNPIWWQRLLKSTFTISLNDHDLHSKSLLQEKAKCSSLICLHISKLIWISCSVLWAVCWGLYQIYFTQVTENTIQRWFSKAHHYFGLHSEPSSLRLGKMIDTTEFYCVIPAWMILAFIQGHSCTRNALVFLQNFQWIWMECSMLLQSVGLLVAIPNLLHMMYVQESESYFLGSFYKSKTFKCPVT